MKEVECCKCGKIFDVIDTNSFTIPKYRCDDCLKNDRK